MTRLFRIFAACVVSSGCSIGFAEQCPQGDQTPETHLSAIAAVRGAELAAFNSGDVEGMQAILTEDIVWDSFNRPAYVGIEQSRKLQEALSARADFFATYEPDEIIIEGNMAFDRGLWYEKMTLKSNGETSHGVYGTLQIYMRGTDGCWRLARSIWNKE